MDGKKTAARSATSAAKIKEAFVVPAKNFGSVAARLPTRFGEFVIKVWPERRGFEPVALVTPQLDSSKPALVRVHSECLTGDVFHSRRCDCGSQKDAALKMIAQSGNGVFIYLRQEGRGIGIYDKIRAYTLQEQGYDTFQANLLLGHQPDERKYDWAKKILDELGVGKIRLLTNNPAKVRELTVLGIEVVERVPVKTGGNRENRKYLETKRVKFRHLLGREDEE